MMNQATGGGEELFFEGLTYLIGADLPRDIPKARHLFRNAVSCGHIDAAFFEMALAATGSGGPPDWQAALALLRQISSQSETARSQLTLIDRMNLQVDGYPTTLPQGEMIGRDPDVVLYRDLVTPGECAVLASSVQDIIEPSTVVDPRSGKLIANPIRSSAGAVVGPTRENLVIGAINRRIAAISSSDVTQGEPLSILCYEKGQEYRTHFDTIAGEANQRIATAIIYMNEGYQGGETLFVANGLRVNGRTGDVILFRNVDENGRPDPMTAHAGLPVQRGVKWVATRWIRARPYDSWRARS